jgi:MFS family permease
VVKSTPARRSAAVPLLLAVQLATGLVLSPAFTFLPVFLKDLGLSATLVSLVIALQRVVGLGSSMAGGVLLDSVGAKRTLVAGQVLYFAATLVFAARAPWPVALLWALSGLGMGPVTLSMTGYLIEKADPARLGLFTALLNWGITIGAVISSPLAGLLVDRSGWQALVPFTALPAVVLVLATAFALPRSARHAGLRPPGSAPGRPLLPSARSARLLALGRLLPTISYGMLLVFVPLLLKAAGVSNTVIALYATAINVGASLLQLAVGRIADRSGWKGPTLASLAALALGSLGIAVFHSHAWPVAACGTVAVSAAWALSALMPVQVTKHVPVAQHGRALGFINQSWYAAMILSGLAGGVLFDVWVGLPFLVGFLTAAAGVPVMLVVARGGDPGGVSEPLRPDPAAREEA